MTKYWKMKGIRDNSPIALITSTTDDQIRTDMALGTTSSLILTEKLTRGILGDLGDQQAHQLLALGAFRTHAEATRINISGQSLEEMNELPTLNISDGHWLGGKLGQRLVSVWEQI